MLAIASVVSALLACGLTYKYQESYYENVIAQEQLARQTEVTNLTKKVLDTERKNNDITSALDKKAVEQASTITGLRKQLDSYRDNSGRLYISANCSKAAPIVADSASLRPPATSAGTSDGMCQLPELFATTVIETAVAADELRARVIIAKEFAEAIEAQRKELSNDNK